MSVCLFLASDVPMPEVTPPQEYPTHINIRLLFDLSSLFLHKKRGASWILAFLAPVRSIMS